MSTKNKSCCLISLFSGILLVSISCRQGNPPAEEAVEVKTPVTVVPVTFKSISSFFDLPAVTSFMNKSMVRATTTGTIEKVLINQGEFVGAGQLLFTIRTREAMAMSNLNSTDSSLYFKGVININSHNEGVVSSISYRKGDFVQEGDELAVVSEQSSLVFILDVPFELEKYIEKNKNCSIILPDNSHIKGTITGKLPDMDMQSQTLKYVVKTLTPEHLPGNLIANIQLIKSTSQNAVVLPKPAVLGDETQTEFWVMKLINDSTAVKVTVSKGFENSDEVEITKPVFVSSDRVILTGNYGLPDTARISIIKD
jgi:biotin carboxyl carrier protein